MMMVEYTVLILTRAMAATAALPAAAALYMQLAFRYDVYKDAG
jgi:hypothetical protein